jgi:hypothetical protein
MIPGAESDRELIRLRRIVAEREAELARGEQRIVELTDRVAELAGQTAELKRTVLALEREVAATRRAVWRIGRAISWQLYSGARGRLVHALGGEGAAPVRAARFVLDGLGRTRGDGRAQWESNPLSDSSPLYLPEPVDPEVSLVIPVHAGVGLTKACLMSLVRNTTEVSYEVIVIEDAADAAVRALLKRVAGASVVVNDNRLGFLRSVNRGAASARGRWLVICNNDIEVRPGWLRALLECAATGDDVAVVTPKYIYPDGSLCEAGGIIWRDGTGWNYGRGDRPDHCRYEFRREVDYGSGAAPTSGAPSAASTSASRRCTTRTATSASRLAGAGSACSTRRARRWYITRVRRPVQTPAAATSGISK